MGIAFALLFLGGIIIGEILNLTIEFAVELGNWLFIMAMFIGEEIIISRITKEKKKKKSIKRILLIYAAFIIIGLLIGFGSDLFKEFSCKSPKMMIGDKCCMPSETSDLMCQEDEAEFIRKIDAAVEAQEFTDGSRIRHTMPNFSFVAPLDYGLIKDVPIAGQKIPYYLLGDGGEYGLLEIKVIVSESTRRYSVDEFVDGFIDGITDKGGRLIDRQNVVLDNGLPTSIILIQKDDLSDMPAELNVEPPIYFKGAFFSDEYAGVVVGFIMSATENYLNEYETEFEQMISTFRFE